MTAYFGQPAWRATRVQMLADWKKGDASCPRAPKKECLASFVEPEILMPGAACGACFRQFRDVLTASSRFSPLRSLGAVHVVSEYEPLCLPYIKSKGSSDSRRVSHLLVLRGV